MGEEENERAGEWVIEKENERVGKTGWEFEREGMRL